MPVLANARHERFAQELAGGSSATEAYKAAGYECEGSSAWSAASRLSRNVEVLTRVAELKAAGAERAEVDRSWVLMRLMANVERAMQAEQVYDRDGKPTGEYRYDGATANRALELLGREIGMFVEKHEHLNRNVTIEDRPAPSDDEWTDRHVTAH